MQKKKHIYQKEFLHIAGLNIKSIGIYRLFYMHYEFLWKGYSCLSRQVLCVKHTYSIHPRVHGGHILSVTSIFYIPIFLG